MTISDLELLAAVREQTSESFVVYGELGKANDAGLALLALECEGNTLVVLIVGATTGPDGATDLNVEVRSELGASAPAPGTICVSCGSRLRPLGRFCPNCGVAGSGQTSAPDAEPDEMRLAVEGSLTDDYELLGDMHWIPGGRVYFVREKSSGAITPLRLHQGTADGEFELVETQVG
ncbi:MAG: zinc ribbon domain-containing protein [Gemmatimonadaceae bacterium]